MSACLEDAVKRFNSMSREEQEASLPYCLMRDGLTLEEFQQFYLQRDACYHCQYENGGAWIYEIGSAKHDSAAGEVVCEISSQLGAQRRDFRCAASPRCDNNDDNWSFEPDGSLTLRRSLGGNPGKNSSNKADKNGNRFPNVVIEVAMTESERHVRGKALQWLHSSPTEPHFGVQLVIVVKIGKDQRKDGHRTMKAWLYQRGGNNPVQYIEFGNHGPNHGAIQLGRPGMQLRLPLSSMYTPVDRPEELGEDLVLDLYYVRDMIEDALP